MSIQGEENLLSLAEELDAGADLNEQIISIKWNANLMRRAARALRRLAPLDPEIEAVMGEN